MGYAHSLGITRTPPAFLPRTRHPYPTDDFREYMYARDPLAFGAMDGVHSPEEQRAFLGCYFVMSV